MKLKLFILTLSTIFQFSCQKPEIHVSNLNNDVILVIGHGGMGIAHSYPMNSYESVRRALSLGANGVEIDVQMTLDGVLVAYHDYDLSQRSSASGQIHLQNWEDISTATYLKPPYTDYSVMRLDSLISGIPERQDVIFVLDCKNYNPDTSEYYLDKFTGALIDLLDDFLPGENVFFDINRIDMVRMLQSKREDLNIFFYGDDFEKAIEIAEEYDLVGITLSVNLISKEQVRIAHSKGRKVSVFNAHTRSRNRNAIEMNVDLIQTDMLRYLIRLLEDSTHGDV
jgi:glycerophosphoryl diester phosphodiesterase